jgi:hypothetical protein
MKRRFPVREVVVNFCFRKAGRPILAAGAFALLVNFAGTPVAFAQAAAQPATKNYKDKDEYDLFLKITQTADPKARLQLLNTWQDKYPTSDYSPERLQFFVATLQALSPSDPTQRQPLIDKCKEELKLDPNAFLPNYYIAYWGPIVGGANPSPDLVSTVETAAKAAIAGADTTFADAKKPPATSAENWNKYKVGAISVGHNSLAWAAVSKKDMATAESEYRASLTANPDQGTVSVQLGKLLVESKDSKKVPDGLFEYARAGEYAGPGAAVAPDARAKLLAYFNTAYKDFHGSADGSAQILDQAKTMALPPAGFTITSAQDLANDQAKKLQIRIDSDPAFKIWYGIKQQLTGDQGATFFSGQLKDFEIPGGSDEASKNFTGTVISVDPSKVVLGVEDPAVPDATILFTTPLKDTEVAKIKVGEKLPFSGIAESYNKDPYMITFKDPTIPGVQTTAPAKTGKKKR